MATRARVPSRGRSAAKDVLIRFAGLLGAAAAGAVFAAILSGHLAAPAYAQAAPGCAAAFEPARDGVWGLDETAWAKECAKGAVPEAIRLEAQRRFIAACRKEYSAQSRGRITDGDVSAYCAQGRTGVVRLRERLGLPPEPVRPAAPEAPAKGQAVEVVTPGVRLYNRVRTEGSRTSPRLPPPADPPLPDGWVFMMMGSPCAEAYAPIDLADPVCYVRFSNPGEKTSRARKRGVIHPTQIYDEGCRGLISTATIDWRGSEGKPKRFGQRELDRVFSLAEDLAFAGCN